MREISTSLLLTSLLSLGFAFGQYAPPAPQQVSVSAQTQAPEPAIDCAGHADGLYVRDPSQCLDGFYKCANGRSFYYRCPTGLFFSPEDAQCEYKQLIPACGGQRPVEASSSAPVATVQVYQPAPAPQAPQQPQSYVQPSQYQQPPAPQQPQSYVQPTQYQQPPAPTTQAPVYTQPPTTQAPVYTQPPTTQAPVYTQPPTTQAPVYTQPPQTQPPVYSQPPVQYQQPQTVPSYQISYGGIPTAPTPPQYNEYTVVPPQQAPVAPSIPAASPPAYQQYGNSAPVAPQLAVSTQAPVDYTCGSNQDGYYYKQQCSASYYSCSGGIATKHNCPGGTVWDPLVQGCDYPDVCGRPRPPTTTTAKPLVNYGYGWQTATQSTECVGKIDGFYARGHCVKEYLHCSNGIAFGLKCPAGLVFRNDSCAYLDDCLNPTVAPPVAVQQPTQPTPPPLTWCRDHQKPDGYFADGCSSTYYACNGGFTQRLTCAASLVYDAQNEICEERQYVIACGGRPRPPTTTTIAAPVAPIQRPNFNCQGKPDSYYTNGCSSTYFVCVGGIATQQLNCPAGLAYDQTTSACEQAQYVPACGGRPTTTTIAAPVAPVVRPNFNCQGKTGYFASNGCVKVYYHCNAGVATELNCPPGTNYSPFLHACDYSSNIPQCGGQLPTTTQQAPQAPIAVASQSGPSQYGYAAPQQQAQAPYQPPQYVQQTTPAPYQPPQYVQQTTPAPVYTQPPTTQAPVYTQPPTTQAPVYVQPTTTLPPQTPPPYSGYQQQPQQQAAPQAFAPVAVAQSQPDTSSNTNQCAHLQNGIYGRRCSRHYFVCTDHKIFEFTCPSGYAYDRTIARCGPINQIQDCASNAGPSPPASQQQQQPQSVQAPASPPSGFFRIRK